MLTHFVNLFSDLFFFTMVEETKENPKNEPSAPLLFPKLSYRTRSYVVQKPAFICVIGYDTDAGRSMSKSVS